jgi:hypothetical protein
MSAAEAELGEGETLAGEGEELKLPKFWAGDAEGDSSPDGVAEPVAEVEGVTIG